MSKAARGTKRICKSCGGKFYDLNRKPIICPLCGATFETEEAPPQEEPVVAKAAVETPKPEPEPETAAAPEAASSDDDDGPELVSLDEAQAEEESLEASDDEDIVDLPEDDDTDIPEAQGDEDAFLEDDDEAEPDVEGIIGSPLKPEDEA